MIDASASLRIACRVLCAATLFGACVIANPDDDAGSGQGESGPGNATANPGSGGGGADSGGTEGGGELPQPCAANLLADPGFEEGTPSVVWTEASNVFGTPICDASCTEDPGASPALGDWWVWFGGVEEPEMASVRQTFSATGDELELQFAFWINAAAGTGDDTVRVLVDDTEVFFVTDAEAADYDQYTAVALDISEFADGADHTLVFAAQLTGAAQSNFFVDEVSIAQCSGGADTGATTTTTTGGMTTVADGSTTAAGSTSSTTGGGSTGGGSTGGASSTTAG